ncbi:uncharacterized protein LOC111919790 [Lactuca sativa]|uniref:uncharacterized protein LOC111919790 n=1 Tax=Lactuca sativa TaxID=4236 RepID=UPI0022B009D0|nr:uncharacterized protein LOC111919790 [Lactuca sativa]
MPTAPISTINGCWLMEVVTVLCYWGGTTCDGLDGINYSKAPKKKQSIYPSVGIGNVVKYIPLPIKDNDDVGIMFDVLRVHQEVSNIDLYLEVEDIDQIQHIEMESSRNHEPVVLEEQRNNELLLHNTNHANVISDMIHNEDFYTISHVVVVSNGIISDNEIDEEDDIGEEYDEEDGVDITQEHEPPHVDKGETSFDNNYQVPSTFTSIEETNVISDGNWTVSRSISKNDFTRELEKYSFKDREELIRAIKLQCIKTYRQFEVIETQPTLWSIRCKLHLQSSCKWQLRARKRKGSGNFEITKYIGPHTCLNNNISLDHTNLDASLIAQETKHLIKEQPSIGVPALRAEIVDKLGYTPSYKKLWTGKQKAIEQMFGNWEESYAALPKKFGALHKFNPGTIVECIDGTHLYDKYTGKMLIAMGVDGNNQILPLAFAIVENESYDSWNWFLSYIKSHVVKKREGICLIFDRHLGILKVLFMTFTNNFNDKFHNSKLKALTYRAGSQNQVRKFNSIMEEIGKLNPQARQWIERHPLDTWTLAHDGGRRYGRLTTNVKDF